MLNEKPSGGNYCLVSSSVSYDACPFHPCLLRSSVTIIFRASYLSVYRVGSSVDPSYYKKKETLVSSISASSAKTSETTLVNKYNLVHPESTKVDLKFRGACYETIEKTLTNLYQGTHRSLSADYMSKLATDLDPSLSKPDIDLRYFFFFWTGPLFTYFQCLKYPFSS